MNEMNDGRGRRRERETEIGVRSFWRERENGARGGEEVASSRRAKMKTQMTTRMTTMDGSFESSKSRRGREPRRGRGGVMTTVMVLIVAWCVGVMVEGTRANVDGAVGDATCDVEEVERANEAQLHSILSELTNTTYFRLFQVDLKRTCKFWGRDEGREG